MILLVNFFLKGPKPVFEVAGGINRMNRDMIPWDLLKPKSIFQWRYRWEIYSEAPSSISGDVLNQWFLFSLSMHSFFVEKCFSPLANDCSY